MGYIILHRHLDGLAIRINTEYIKIYAPCADGGTCVTLKDDKAPTIYKETVEQLDRAMRNVRGVE